MKFKYGVLAGAVAIAAFAALKALSDEDGTVLIAQQPLFTKASLPPLNMLVIGKDHKIYYEAYNDASDLNGDGVPDVGYKPAQIDYYGYFNSHACYTWTGDYFAPSSSTQTKKCSGAWSGDFLNYLTTSRMDALRRVLYGGWRQTDNNAGLTILQGAFFPQDAHSWGKEYRSVAHDGYDIADYAPLTVPAPGKYHLFAVTTTSDNTAPWFRVMQNSDFRVWNWLSIEGPVAGKSCFTSDNQRVPCVGGSSTWQLVPAANFSGLQVTTWKRTGNPSASPTDKAAMDAFFSAHAVPKWLCGSGSVTQIDKTANGNPFTGSNSCNNVNYLTRIQGTLVVTSPGTYTFAVDGDDAVDVLINGSLVASWYGGHGNNRTDSGLASHSGTVTLAAGNHTIEFRHQQGSGSDNWGLFWQNTAAANRRDDYKVRLQVCPDTESLRDSSCRAYPNGHYKPTGILHDYGMTQRMYFGLITGSQPNNLEGGVLRRNISNFADEVDAQTGQIRTDVDGIVHTLDRLRMIGGGYEDTTDNYAADSNWKWANGTGNCPSIGGRVIVNGECRMWGNPIAEMMYESLRYFAGAAGGTTRFLPAAGVIEGRTEETTMGLTTATWKNPYGSGGYSMCSRPYQTVISDINPSYDGDLPGSQFSGTVTTVNDTPSTIAGFSAGNEGQAVWNAEGLGSTPVFIGEVAGNTDDAPTAKLASSFGNIRGLAPEEPTKGGTYYAASVARYGRMTDLNPANGKQNLATYSIALASPLPRMEFPVNGSTVTILPFGKTVSGTFGESDRKPTNTIVDFYIQSMEYDTSGNLKKAMFRISYEDVEQGNDHDMDAIVLYEITAQSDNTVTVKLTSEYAAGSANQNLGYVISGTTKDGVYLEVRDKDAPTYQYVNTAAKNCGANQDQDCRNGWRPYALNTPPNQDPGYCQNNSSQECGLLPLNSTRTFTPGNAGTGIQLKDPLWYAAKYGGPNSQNGGAGDVDAKGDPTNYFLVSNALNLRSQLSKAFDSIENQQGNSGSIGISGAQVGRPSNSYVVIPSYASANNGHDWIGDLVRKEVGEDGLPVAASTWSASSKLKDTASSRNIWTALSYVDKDNRSLAVKEFTSESLVDDAAISFDDFGYSASQVANLFGSIQVSDMIQYLRGDQSMEGSVLNSKPFRVRSSILGDIVNSEPVLATSRSNFGWSRASGLTTAERDGYAAYVKGKSEQHEYAFVGANDGMLHAFDATDGQEKFAYVPNGVFGNLGLLAEGGADGTSAGYTHHFYVDGKLNVADAYGGGWKTLLVGATGAGGRSVFGLDVTNPAGFGASNVLWEVTGVKYPELGYVMGKPVVVPLQNGQWVALFGNGYNSEAGTGHTKGDAALFVVDAFTGEVLRIITPADGSGAANGLGNIAPLDTNYDGLIDAVYGGDLLGNVWKFDLSADIKSSWGVAYDGKPLFQALGRDGHPQPITGGLDVAVGPGNGYMVYFGTGRYFAQGDNDPEAVISKQVQSFYAVWDNGVAGTVSRSGLVQQSISGRVLSKTDENGVTIDGYTTIASSPVNYLSNRGWFIDLVVGANTDTGLGERFISRPAIRDGVLLFDTYQPGGSEDECGPGGLNFRYGLSLMTGAAAFPSARDESGHPIPNTAGGQLESGAPSMGPGSTYPATDYPPVYCELDEDGKCKESAPGVGGLKCSIVILDSGNPGKSVVKQRPCGRQSWRQLR
jgi:type IV pilus assembly protein PilY1